MKFYSLKAMPALLGPAYQSPVKPYEQVLRYFLILWHFGDIRGFLLRFAHGIATFIWDYWGRVADPMYTTVPESAI